MDRPKDGFHHDDFQEGALPEMDGCSDSPIDAAKRRRVTVAVCWALARRAALDSRELFEDSYAINEEFREWLLTLEEHPELLQASLLMMPKDLRNAQRPETDGLLEI
jgi:hypothetical protein